MSVIAGYDCLLGLDCPTSFTACTWKAYTVYGSNPSTVSLVAELFVRIGPPGNFVNSAESSSFTAFELKLDIHEIKSYVTIITPPHCDDITKYFLKGVFLLGRFGPDEVYCARSEPYD